MTENEVKSLEVGFYLKPIKVGLFKKDHTFIVHYVDMFQYIKMYFEIKDIDRDNEIKIRHLSPAQMKVYFDIYI